MAGEKDTKGLEYVEITDFSAGIYDASNMILSVGGNQGIFPAPLGAANGNFTFGCMALRTGGLGPLPQATIRKALSDLGITTGASTVNVTAFINTFATSNDEFVLALNYLTGSTDNVDIYSAVWTGGTHSIFSATGAAGTYPAGSTYPFSTRVAPSAPTTTVGQPVIVIPVGMPTAGDAEGFILLYPDPSAPTSFGTYDILQGGTVPGTTGSAFGHQGRIVVIEQTPFDWPVTPTQDSLIEAISYTDPPNSQTWPDQHIVFGPENPYGYGAVGSVSAGELFMVKCRGGGIVVQGDLNNPTVTTLPGVKGTGQIYGRTSTDQNGLYYCSQDGGAWLWNGGNSATKVSTQLSDNFFVPRGAQIPSIYYAYFCQRWVDWMLFSNGYVLNSLTGAWWRLDGTGGFYPFWFVPGYEENVMYMASGQTDDTTPFIYQMDRTIPTTGYSWQSLPIKVQNRDRLINIREVVVKAINTYGTSGSQVVVTVIDSFGNNHVLDTWTLDSSTTDVQIARLNCGQAKSQDITLNVSVSGPAGAPTLVSIGAAYRPQEHVGVT